MSHLLYFTDRSKTPLEITNGTLDLSTSITEQGLGVTPYGFHINQAFLWLLTNFANSTPPANPVQGQMWFDNFIQQLKCWTGSEWNVIGRVVFSTTPPLDTKELWFDENESQLKIFNGSTYQSVASLYLELTGGTVSGDLTIPQVSVDGTVNIPLDSPVTPIDLDQLVIYNTYSLSPLLAFSDPSSATFLTLETGVQDMELVSSQSVTINSEKAIFSVRSAGAFPDASHTVAQFSQEDSSRVIDLYRSINVNGYSIFDVPSSTVPSSMVPKSALNQVTNQKGDFVATIGDTMSGSLISSVDHGTTDSNFSIEKLILSNSSQSRSIELDGATNSGYLQITNTGGAGNVQLVNLNHTTSIINFHQRTIANVTSPTQNADLGNKSYADASFAGAENQITNELGARQAKAWIKFDKNTDTIVNSFNVDSLSKISTGQWQVTFSTAIGSLRMSVPSDESVTINNNNTSSVLRVMTQAEDVNSVTANIYRTYDFIQNAIGHDGGDDGEVDAYLIDRAVRSLYSGGAQYVCVVFYGR